MWLIHSTGVSIFFSTMPLHVCPILARHQKLDQIHQKLIRNLSGIRLVSFHWSIIIFRHNAPARLPHLGTTLEIRLDSLEINQKFIRNQIRFIPLEYHYFSAQCPCAFAPCWHDIRNQIRFIPLEYHYFSAQCPCAFAPSWHDIRNQIRFISLEYYFSAQCPCAFAPSWYDMSNQIYFTGVSLFFSTMPLRDCPILAQHQKLDSLEIHQKFIGNSSEIRLDSFHWSIIIFLHNAPARLPHLGTTLEIPSGRNVVVAFTYILQTP